MNEYINMWKNFADFSGRANVRDYWMAFLFHVIVSIVVIFVANSTTMVLGSIYSLASFVPYVSLGVRRLRDAGQNVNLILWMLLPCPGFFILIFYYLKPSVPSGPSDPSDWNNPPPSNWNP